MNKNKLPSIPSNLVEPKIGKPTFEDIAVGYTFKIIGVDSLPKGSKFSCAFCNGRGRHYIEIERNDGQRFKVGKTCLGHVGLRIDDKPAIKKKPGRKKKRVSVKPPEDLPKLDSKKIDMEILDDILNSM